MRPSNRWRQMRVNHLRRREFITLLGGAAVAWPFAARGQQPPKMARIGYLAPAYSPDLIEPLRGGLRDLGYIEGQNLAIEYRFALGQSKTYDELAAELVHLGLAAIVLTGTPAALATKRQTTTIPIIMAPIGDPLALGLAASPGTAGGTAGKARGRARRSRAGMTPNVRHPTRCRRPARSYARADDASSPSPRCAGRR
jgi:hypothetical protein